MQIRFQTVKMQKACSSDKAMRKEWGNLTGKLQLRLTQLHAAPSLAAMTCLPGARCHELSGQRDGQFAVDLVHPFRLVFAPDHDPPPWKADGGLDLAQITQITVLEIVDYH